MNKNHTYKTTKPYEEEYAQSLLSEGKIDDLIIYCSEGAIFSYLSKNKWFFIDKENYEDIYQELCIITIKSIHSYSPDKKVKLLSWLFTNYRYFCLSYLNNLKKHFGKFEQLDEDNQDNSDLSMNYDTDFDE